MKCSALGKITHDQDIFSKGLKNMERKPKIVQNLSQKYESREIWIR